MSHLQKIGLLNREGMKSFNAGKLDDAMFQLIQADHIAQDMKSPLHKAKIRNNMGLVHQGLGNVSEAIVCFRLAEKYVVEGAGSSNKLYETVTRNRTRLVQSAEAQAA